MRRLSGIVEGWNHFWFRVLVHRQYRLIHNLLCLVTILWWFSFWIGIDDWFSLNGWFNADLATNLIYFKNPADATLRWSFLWWFPSRFGVHAAIIVGILSSLLALMYARWWTLLIQWLAVVSWSHRIGWLNSTFEPALASFLLYDLLAHAIPTPQAKMDTPDALLCKHLAIRLLQVHTWGLLVAGVLHQIAGIVWVNGEAVWWISAAGRSNCLPAGWMITSPLLANALSHGFIGVQFVAVALVLYPSTSRLGLGLGYLAALGYAFLADYVLYGFLLCIGLLAIGVGTKQSAN